MSLMGSFIGILFPVLLVCRFVSLDITICAVVSVAICSVDGYTNLRLAAYSPPLELYICRCCNLGATVLKTSDSCFSNCLCRVFIFIGITGCEFWRVCTRSSNDCWRVTEFVVDVMTQWFSNKTEAPANLLEFLYTI